MTTKERLFQFFHLPRGKVGARATSLVVADAAVSVATETVLILVTWQAISGSGTRRRLHYTITNTSAYLWSKFCNIKQIRIIFIFHVNVSVSHSHDAVSLLWLIIAHKQRVYFIPHPHFCPELPQFLQERWGQKVRNLASSFHTIRWWADLMSKRSNSAGLDETVSSDWHNMFNPNSVQCGLPLWRVDLGICPTP